MYSFFSSKLTYWHDDVLQAILANIPPPDYELKWAYGKSLPLTFEFSFSIMDDAPLLDNYWTGSLYSLYSEKLLSIFREANIRFDLFTAKTFSKSTRKLNDLRYKVFRLTEISDCLDNNKTIFKFLPSGKGQIKSLIKPSFTENFLKSRKMLTRVAGYENLIIIHPELKKVIEDEKISGCEFKSERFDESSLFSIV